MPFSTANSSDGRATITYSRPGASGSDPYVEVECRVSPDGALLVYVNPVNGSSEVRIGIPNAILFDGQLDW